MAPVSRDTLRKIAATRNSITRISPGRKLNNKWHSLMNFIYPPPSLPLSFFLSLSSFTLPGWHGSIHSKERVTRSFSILGIFIVRRGGGEDKKTERLVEVKEAWGGNVGRENGRPFKERSTVSQTEDLEIISLRGRAKLWNSSFVLEPITTSFNERPFSTSLDVSLDLMT